MKIAIITSRYPSEGNPYNHMFIHIRSKEFIKQGEEITVYVPDAKTNEYIFEGVLVKVMPSKDIVKQLKQFNVLYLHLLHMYPFMKTNGWPIYKAIIKEKYNFAMYVHGSEMTYFKDRFFGGRLRLKEVLQWIRKDYYSMPKLKWFLDQIDDKRKGVLITPSKWMKTQIENICSKRDIYVIPNGIDLQLFPFTIKKSGVSLITIRPLSDKVYDIESTIEVLSLLPTKYTLDIYGEGRYKSEYEILIKRLGLSKRIKIIDKFIDINKMNHLFNQYNIFISTTKLDSQGVTMLEAMSSGLLVGTINNSSKKEFISDMKTGVLGDNPKELADKILKVTSDEGLFKSITNAGRESMEKIGIKTTALKELKILRNIGS